jgi:hypothetical protein
LLFANTQQLQYVYKKLSKIHKLSLLSRKNSYCSFFIFCTNFTAIER